MFVLRFFLRRLFLSLGRLFGTVNTLYVVGGSDRHRMLYMGELTDTSDDPLSGRRRWICQYPTTAEFFVDPGIAQKIMGHAQERLQAGRFPGSPFPQTLKVRQATILLIPYVHR